MVKVPPILMDEPEVTIVPAPELLHTPPNVRVALIAVTPLAATLLQTPLPPTVMVPPVVVMVPAFVPVPLLLIVMLEPEVADMVPLLVHETKFMVKVPPPSLLIIPLLVSTEPE